MMVTVFIRISGFLQPIRLRKQGKRLIRSPVNLISMILCPLPKHFGQNLVPCDVRYPALRSRKPELGNPAQNDADILSKAFGYRSCGYKFAGINIQPERPGFPLYGNDGAPKYFCRCRNWLFTVPLIKIVFFLFRPFSSHNFIKAMGIPDAPGSVMAVLLLLIIFQAHTQKTECQYGRISPGGPFPRSARFCGTVLSVHP